MQNAYECVIPICNTSTFHVTYPVGINYVHSHRRMWCKIIYILYITRQAINKTNLIILGSLFIIIKPIVNIYAGEWVYMRWMLPWLRVPLKRSLIIASMTNCQPDGIGWSLWKCVSNILDSNRWRRIYEWTSVCGTICFIHWILVFPLRCGKLNVSDTILEGVSN